MNITKKSIKQGKYSRVLREVSFFEAGASVSILTLTCDVIHRAGGYYAHNTCDWEANRQEETHRAFYDSINHLGIDARYSAIRKNMNAFVEKNNLPNFKPKFSGMGIGFGGGNKSVVAKKARIEFRAMVQEAEAYLAGIDTIPEGI